MVDTVLATGGLISGMKSSVSSDRLPTVSQPWPARPRFGARNGALGFWSAVRDVWPETTPQRDWLPQDGQRAGQAAEAVAAAG